MAFISLSDAIRTFASCMSQNIHSLVVLTNSQWFLCNPSLLASSFGQNTSWRKQYCVKWEILKFQFKSKACFTIRQKHFIIEIVKNFERKQKKWTIQRQISVKLTIKLLSIFSKYNNYLDETLHTVSFIYFICYTHIQTVYSLREIFAACFQRKKSFVKNLSHAPR